MTIKLTREQVEAVWFTKMSNDEVRKALGVTDYQLWMLKKHFALPRRPSVPAGDDPDQATIKRMCAEFRAKWTPLERESRRVGGRRRRWRLPSYTCNQAGQFSAASALH
jgi:hypothetical protein